jgi:hypothetical protein
MRQVGGFLRISSTNKTDSHDITEILLKVALTTIDQTEPIFKWGLRPSDFFTIANIIHMANSVSRRLNILCIMFKIRVFLITILFVPGYVWRFSFYLHVTKLAWLHHFTTREIWANKTSLTPSHFIRIPV